MGVIFHPTYQEIINLKDMSLFGFEVLMRILCRS